MYKDIHTYEFKTYVIKLQFHVASEYHWSTYTEAFKIMNLI